MDDPIFNEAMKIVDPMFYGERLARLPKARARPRPTREAPPCSRGPPVAADLRPPAKSCSRAPRRCRAPPPPPSGLAHGCACLSCRVVLCCLQVVVLSSDDEFMMMDWSNIW